MSASLHITSLANDRVKALVRLRQARERRQAGVFLVEEPLVIVRALDAGQEIREVWACPDLLDETGRALRDRALATGAVHIEVTAPVMEKIGYRDKPDGLLLVAARRPTGLADLALPAEGAPLVLVLEDVEKPGNLGAALRIADGAGVDAVIACGGTLDLDNPNCLRASRGAFFSVPCAAAPVADTVAWLREHGLAAVAVTPEATTAWDDHDLTAPTALLLGAEDKGLGPELRDAATAAVALPMHGAADSLNVSSAAAALLYEAVRQRRAATEMEP